MPFFAFSYLCVLFVSMHAADFVSMVQREQVIMGTFVSLTLEQKDKQYFHPSFELLKNIEKSLSNYDKSALLYQLNHKGSIKADKYLLESLMLSKEYYKETEGYFNVAIGSITKELYHFGEEDAALPDVKIVENSVIDLEKISISKEKIVLDRGVHIDLGGMGKGYGIDKLHEYLLHKGVTKAVIALSGDIRCVGKCPIAIYNPFDENQPLASFYIQDAGVSTSGTYRRYIQSKKNNHLINPKTKTPQNTFISVTLISSDIASSALDAYATAVSVMPLEKALSFLKKQQLAYILLTDDKRLFISKNIAHYTDDLLLQEALYEQPEYIQKRRYQQKETNQFYIYKDIQTRKNQKR